MIINLTQHPATPEQTAAGVVDLTGDRLARLKDALTFVACPSEREIRERAVQITYLAIEALSGNTEKPQQVMVGGALWLMAPLINGLRSHGMSPVFAFSVRETEEQTQPDGSVRKVAVFRHAGFVPGIL